MTYPNRSWRPQRPGPKVIHPIGGPRPATARNPRLAGAQPGVQPGVQRTGYQPLPSSWRPKQGRPTQPGTPLAPPAPVAPVIRTPQDLINQQLGVIRQEQRTHQGYADRGAEWLAGQLAPLQQGVRDDTSSYQAYLRSIGALAAAGDQIQGTQPGVGAAVGRSLEVPGGIRAQLDANRSATAIAGLIANAKRYATDLPGVYNKYANDQMVRMGQWATEFQAQREAAMAAAGRPPDVTINPGRSTTGGTPKPPGGYAPGTTPPPGYFAVPRSDGGVDFVPDKTFVAPQARTPAAAAGGYRGLGPKDYAKLKTDWATRAEVLLNVPYNTGKTDPDTGKPSMGTRPLMQVLDMMVSSGLRPSDAFQIGVSSYRGNEPLPDPKGVYQWLLQYLPEKNARTVTIRFTGVDPITPTGRSGSFVSGGGAPNVGRRVPVKPKTPSKKAPVRAVRQPQTAPVFAPNPLSSPLFGGK